jgi:3-phenylpropionate/cinnamic acid dioxygenase small subunit
MSAEEDIRRILAMGVQKIDDRDVEGYVALFSEEAHVITRTVEYEGREAMREGLTAAFGSWPPGSVTKHLLGASVIEVKGAEAEALSDLVVFQALAEGGWTILQAGRYQDSFVLENGDWRISKRQVIADVFHRSSYPKSSGSEK